jgi:hypothetical protein
MYVDGQDMSDHDPTMIQPSHPSSGVPLCGLCGSSLSGLCVKEVSKASRRGRRGMRGDRRGV